MGGLAFFWTAQSNAINQLLPPSPFTHSSYLPPKPALWSNNILNKKYFLTSLKPGSIFNTFILFSSFT
jgi:hypothetical protein